VESGSPRKVTVKSELNRTASRATTSTTTSSTTANTCTPLPPSHFSFRTRADANSRVDMIVKRSYSSKGVCELPKSPTAFGAAWNGGGNIRAILEGDDAVSLGPERDGPEEAGSGRARRLSDDGVSSGATAGVRRESSFSSLDIEDVYGNGIEQRLGFKSS